MNVESRYNARADNLHLIVSFVCASLILGIAASFIPEEYIELRPITGKNVTVQLLDLSNYFKDDADGEGGGGGGGPQKEIPAAEAGDVTLADIRMGTPVAVKEVDSAAVTAINIPTSDTGMGIGIGDGSGIGSGSGSGIGSGSGSGRGDGIGDGMGGFATPPRLLIMAMPAYPKSEAKYKTGVTVQLSVRVNTEGKVDSVIVLDNPTGREAFAVSARQAALGSRYEPARSRERAVTCWTRCDYTFSQQ